MWSTVDGYDAFTSSYGGGLEIDLSKGWTIGGQYNTLNTKLNGTDSTSNMNREHFGVFNSFHGKHLSLITNGGLTNDKYNYSRNVEGVTITGIWRVPRDAQSGPHQLFSV